ncbi:hypothetical protein AB6A40_000382 [Gnathostoma spinigerum]|uniref:Dual specificity phosphatase n=1 Tax=Gnathostoma spinigerum TaxID=75299 RepID=A0ABD6E221_9BILA
MSPLSFSVNPEYANMSEVVPGLFISGVLGLTRENIIQKGISLIVNATDEVPNLKSLGDIPRIKLWWFDTTNQEIYRELDTITDRIRATMETGGKVLVHSVEGVSRCATLCLAFLTKYKCSSLRHAYFYLASKRALVKPNIGFWRQLIAFEQETKKNAGSVHLVRDEVVPEILIADVYIKKSKAQLEVEAQSENMFDSRSRHSSGSTLRFSPVLETLSETEATV